MAEESQISFEKEGFCDMMKMVYFMDVTEDILYKRN